MEPKKYDFEVQIRAGDFEYINLKENGSPSEAVAAFDHLKQAWLKRNGLPIDEFCEFVYRQVRGEDNHIAQMEGMNDNQLKVMQAVKRAMKAGPLKK